MPTYPVLDLPLPEGIVTLADYAARIGRTEDYLYKFWSPRPRFPEPAGTLRPPPGTRQRGKFAFWETELDAFRRGEPDLWGRSPRSLVVTGTAPGRRMTLEEFAGALGLPSGAMLRRGDPPLPAAGPGGRYLAGELAAWWNGRGGTDTEVVLTEAGDDELVTLSWFARCISKDTKTVYQYRDTQGFPAARSQGLYRLGDLAGRDGYWYSRPGKRGTAQRKRPAA
jgi:hypothetical protein